MTEIDLRPVAGTVVVRAGGAVVAERPNAVTLLEEGYPPVHYIPRADIGMAFLDPSPTRTTCPHKGEAEYFHLAAKSGAIRDAAWSYPSPPEALAAIAGLVAFDAEKATVELL